MNEMTRPNVPSIDLVAALDPSSLSYYIEHSIQRTRRRHRGVLLERFVKFTGRNQHRHSGRFRRRSRRRLREEI